MFQAKCDNSIIVVMSHMFLCADAGHLYMWGSNTFGQIGDTSIKLQANIPVSLIL